MTLHALANLVLHGVDGVPGVRGQVHARVEGIGGRLLATTPRVPAPGPACWSACDADGGPFVQTVVVPDVLTITVFENRAGWVYTSDTEVGRCTVNPRVAQERTGVDLSLGGKLYIEFATLGSHPRTPVASPTIYARDPDPAAVGAVPRPLLRERKLVRVLSIDGGGVRGIIPGVWLAHLEAVTGRRVHELFDVVAGTSTGGLVALCLTHRRADGTVMSAAELTALYAEKSSVIFGNPHSRVMGPGYNRSDFDGVIKNFVSDNAPMSESIIPTIVSTYDMKEKKVHFFKSWKHSVTKLFAVQCTTAAPTFFAPPEVPAGSPYAGGVFIDGGVAANNPALKAYLCAKDELYGPDHDFVVVSLGTGIATDAVSKTLTPAIVGSWGYLGWIRPDAGDLISTLVDISSQVADSHIRELLHDKYQRFQQALTKGSNDLDNTTPQNIAALLWEGEAMVYNHRTADVASRLLHP
eukprot:m51a1_g4300 hypothetical protein (467) ;mRNA; r:10054-11744